MNLDRNDACIAHFFTQTAPVCTSRLTFIDSRTNERIVLTDDMLTYAGVTITFNFEVRTNRVYRVSISASNAFGQANSAIPRLSKNS